ncbi:MAG: sulfatase-like hydrolase/transferase [Kiritimatiellia bacterium]|jgi:arylsulfatase A-like enzyme|nr:sulfatase-like hydrolase/transferase [Kiritimatiellia bacterium]
MKRWVLTIVVLLTVTSLLQAETPNIILCMADDQGWGDTAYNGHPELKTPHLDAMSKAGLRFDRFYAAAPVCTPTRGSVMTGRHPNRFACFKWGHALRPQETTIAEALKTKGYVTGHFGKWHLGSVRTGSPVNPGSSGFDHWLSAPNFYDNDPILSREGKAVQLKGESSIIAADAAIEFIGKQAKASKPFLAVVWFGSPHSPHRAVAEDLAHYGNKGHWQGEITGLDRAVGKLRAALRDLKIHENTLFWYCSDNGGLKTASSGGRGKKGSIYEGGLRVPGIIEWPARIPKARSSALPANTSDIYPTLLAITDVAVEKQARLDGISLLPLINGETMIERPGGMGFWDYPAGGISTPSAAWMAELLKAQAAGDESKNKSRLRLDAGKIKGNYAEDRFSGHSAWLNWPWKLHRVGGKKAGTPRIELYDLAADPMEKQNLAAGNPDRVKTMGAELEKWLASVARSLNGKDY